PVVEVLVSDDELTPVEVIADTAPRHRGPGRVTAGPDVRVVGNEPALFAVEVDAAVRADDPTPDIEILRRTARTIEDPVRPGEVPVDRRAHVEQPEASDEVDDPRVAAPTGITPAKRPHRRTQAEIDVMIERQRHATERPRHVGDLGVGAPEI